MWAAPPNAVLPHVVGATGPAGPGPLLSRLELGGDPDTDCAWAGSPPILGQWAREENRGPPWGAGPPVGQTWSEPFCWTLRKEDAAPATTGVGLPCSGLQASNGVTRVQASWWSGGCLFLVHQPAAPIHHPSFQRQDGHYLGRNGQISGQCCPWGLLDFLQEGK